MTESVSSSQRDEEAYALFTRGEWSEQVAVGDFIRRNFTPYWGDASFLSGATSRTERLWKKVSELLQRERERGLLDVSADRGTSILAHAPGYIDRELEIIVGLQTDAPLKRAIAPNGGLRMVESALEAYGYTLDPKIREIYATYRKDHNRGVFDVYSPDILACRKAGLITGLPDAYGRGRIIGDYRRVALYGVDFLIESKKCEKAELDDLEFTEEVVRAREELSEQIGALDELKSMAKAYGFDIRRPARTALEATQWLYFGYLGAVKEQNGAAMSLGRVSTFLDVYFERDLRTGRLSEVEAQEIIDQFVIKLRLVRFLRTPDYAELFSGDPTWVTEAIGGVAADGRPLVSKTSYRMLNTLRTLGPAPEPNLTVLWSKHLPPAFKVYCTELSIETSSIQYESDDLMRPIWGDDYAIACCVSAMRIGKQMQFFGARANLAKALLYAINGGVDEVSETRVLQGLTPITKDVLEYEEVTSKLEVVLDKLASVYVKALNAIHQMHDKYHYERLEMALHDRDIVRTMATGIAGLSVAADSLSAIRYASVRVLRNASGIATDFAVSGEYPAFGNNDDRVDGMAVWLVERFMRALSGQRTYRGSVPTQSVLTITSNVVYGKKTGNTPDGRRAGEPLAPGANPMNGRDRAGFVAAGASLAKLPYRESLDGISWTASLVREALGRTPADRVKNLAACLDGFFASSGFHVNINVLDRKMLLDAMDHPELYPDLTIRVSGYAVHFVKLTREQQLDIVHRTFHDRT